MSVRNKSASTPSSSSSSSQPTPSSANSIQAIIEQAKLANQSFCQSNPHLFGNGPGAPTGAPPTFMQKIAEKTTPFRLQFKQKIVKIAAVEDRYYAKITIKLYDGTYKRLKPMSDSLGDILGPAFTKSGFETTLSGKLFYVCSDSKESFTKWGFQKQLTGGDLKKVKDGKFEFWVLPQKDPPTGSQWASPFAMLRTIFNDTTSQTSKSGARAVNPVGKVDDTTYEFKRDGASASGKVAEFELILLQ